MAPESLCVYVCVLESRSFWHLPPVVERSFRMSRRNLAWRNKIRWLWYIHTTHIKPHCKEQRAGYRAHSPFISLTHANKWTSSWTWCFIIPTICECLKNRAFSLPRLHPHSTRLSECLVRTQELCAIPAKHASYTKVSGKNFMWMLLWSLGMAQWDSLVPKSPVGRKHLRNK